MPIAAQPGGAAEGGGTTTTKEKTRRERMWEQRMQEKQGLANPAPPGQHGVLQKNDPTSLLDQMNPASRAGVILSPKNMTLK